MPVVAQALTGAILAQFTAKQYTGKNAVDLATVVGTAVANYVTLPNLVTCTLAGVAGPIGQINSIAVAGLTPTAMSTLMYTKALSKNLTGKEISGIFTAISRDIVPILMGMILTGTAVGVATGTGVGFFTAVNEQALSKLIYAQMLRKQFSGKNAMDLADCISFGISTQLISAAKFTVVSLGAIAPVPPVGPVPVAGIPSLTTSIA